MREAKPLAAYREQPIRVITVGSMQKRFTIDEEVLILDSADTKAKVIRERLFNSQYANLDFKEIIDGITYLANFLDTGTVTLEEKVADLLRDGTKSEKYLGVIT